MELLKHFPRNTVGRDLVVGDIHGHFAKLDEALKAARFDPAGGDRLFSVGDLVDRGPESDRVLDWLGQPWFHAVAGNHEDMAILWNEGSISPESYARNGGTWNMINTKDHCEVLASCFAALPVAIEIETEAGLVGIVHADCPGPDWAAFATFLRKVEVGEVDMGTFSGVAAHAYWSRERFDRMDTTPVSGVVAVVVGHTPVDTVSALGNTLYIDTGAWKKGRFGHPFTLIDAATLRPVQ